MQVFARDRGICAHCGLDTQMLERALLDLCVTHAPVTAREQAAAAGFKLQFCPKENGRFKIRSLWELDHILPVALGGGSCGLDNMATLCARCHHVKTAEQARARAAAKKKKP